MVSDSLYDLCLPVLKDDALDEEAKTDKLEALLREEGALDGRSLQDAILSALWRYRDATVPLPASPPAKSVQLRRGSPAPWQIPRTVTPSASPALPSASPASSGLVGPAGGVSRVRSSTASPFASPRPSPRLAFTSPIPHSPNLNQYEFSEPSAPGAPDYGDYGSDTVDWLVNDPTPSSRPTSSGTGSNLSGAAAPWTQPQQAEMSPFDMLRSLLGATRPDEEIEAALQANEYDLSATIVTLMGEPPADDLAAEGQVLIGKNMLTDPLPVGASPSKSNVMCKYWIATGNCLRADCRFSHEHRTTLCRYWLMGNCYAGDLCVFSHDPSQLVASVNLEGAADADAARPSFQVQDYDAFPQLAHNMLPRNTGPNDYPFARPGSSRGLTNQGFPGGPNFASSSPRSFGSRPTSRHSSRPVTPSLPLVDDSEAFPSLGSASKGGKKHHGKRGHGHGHAKENVPNSLADVVRMSPSSAPALLRKGLTKTRSYGRDYAAASAIPPPERIPWLETGDKANQAYLKARQEAFKHGGLRNKFLQRFVFTES